MIFLFISFEMVHEIENFYGVYLLYSVNPKYKGRTYIGFTVDPNRRLQQHNGGIQAGGAKRTNGRGPWEMVLIVHGFPNMISALRFEWAWTKPKISRRLRHLVKKKAKETTFMYCIRVVCEMLRTGPWSRLPLTVRWLKQEYEVPFDPQLLPPSHMPMAYGPVKSRKAKADVSQKDVTDNVDIGHVCTVCSCMLVPDADTLSCIACHATSHIICLARHFRCQHEQHGFLLPINGSCPSCSADLLWGDLVRYKRGCYQNRSSVQNNEPDLHAHWADDI